MPIDLVIFDCDGVLVDSEVVSCRAHAEILTRYGYPITSDQVLVRFLGVSDREARLTVENELGRELPDDFEAQMKKAALQRVAPERCLVIEDSVSRRHRRSGGRDDGARLSRWQPLPPRPC